MVDEWKAPENETEAQRIEREDRELRAAIREEDERVERKSWKMLEKTMLANVQEQRRSRRWGSSSSC